MYYWYFFQCYENLYENLLVIIIFKFTPRIFEWKFVHGNLLLLINFLKCIFCNLKKRKSCIRETDHLESFITLIAILF